MTAIRAREEFIPSLEDSQLAQGALDQWSSLLEKGAPKSVELELQLAEKLKSIPVKVPAGILELILELLMQTASGNTVTIIPSTKEFTTQEAADFLNVSRPYVIKLLDNGAIPFHRIGAHRRIKATDLLSYKQSFDADSKAAFEELAKISQDLKLGYE